MTLSSVDAHVHKSMDLLQANLDRMCQLSNTCKAWCVALVSAVLLFAIKEQRRDILMVMMMPVGLFYVLDAYYLSVERELLALAQTLAEKVRTENVRIADVFMIRTSKGWVRLFLLAKAMFWSWSTLPFYGTIAGVIVWVAWWRSSTTSP